MSQPTQADSCHTETIKDGKDNRITETVVFTDQAYLKRRVQARAKKGLNQYLIEVQAFALDADSAQAAVFGEGEILSVQYREVPVKEAPQKDVRKLESKKEQLERQRQVLRKEKEVQDKQGRFLDSIVGFAETDLPKKMKTDFPAQENLAGMLEFLGENYQKLAEKHTDLKHRIQELDKEISLIDRQLKNSRRPQGKARKGIEVVFESLKDQPLTIEVSYVAMQAAWEPVYKVEVPQDLSGITLTLMARIHQKTGENWDQVKLAVSNAIPLKGTALPDLQSWYVNLPSKEMLFVGGAVELGAAPAAAGAPEACEEAELDGETEIFDEMQLSEPRAEYRTAEQKELPMAFEYELSQPISLESGGGDAMLPLFTKELPGEFFVYAVPQNDPLSYLVCRSTPDSALLAGKLNIHFGGRFVGGTYLAEKKAGEDLLINLGAERGLKILREKITDRRNETIFGKVERSSVAREMEYRIAIENLNGAPARIQVLDSIPVSKTDRIQIKGIETHPTPAMKDYQEREGVMLWDLEIKPQSVQDIRIKFYVKHPKDQAPWGL